MDELSNAKQPDDEPKTPEEYARLFDAIINSREFPKEYEFTGSIFSIQQNLPVSGFRAGLPWLGLKAYEFKDMESLRKGAKDYKFYFDCTPKITLYISRQTKPPRRRGTYREVCFLGSIPWHVLDEL